MLSVWEILIILLVLLVMAGAAVGAVVLVVWLTRRGKPSPPVTVPRAGGTQPPKAVGTCPRCGTAVSADAPQGLCPRCVLGVGLATHTEAGGESGPHGTKVLQPPLAPADIASHFPQLEILECLGRGGMGVVYKARQPKLNRLVALKILAPEKGADPRFAERFLREAQALARLSHPNIVTVHDFGEADGLYYLLMEYVDGVTLRQLLQTRKIAPEEALGIVPKICDALQFAHQLGVVHRDIKPENVLLDQQGRVKIADFGIAKLVSGAPLAPSEAEKVSCGTGEGTLTQDQVLGTPHYMAPEQVETPQLVDHRADIYSLGVVFYEMLTGELPLGKFQPPSRKVQVDVRLDEVVLHALEKEPERRYQHASEVKTDLETIAAAPAAPPPAGAAAQPVRILRWRDAWLWNWEYIQLFLIVPVAVVALALPFCLKFWGLKALWLFALELPGIVFAVIYGVVGRRVQKSKAALPRTGSEVAECLMFRRPFQAPGLAVLHEDRLELIPVVGSPITVILADIVAVKEVKWFNGTRLWFKIGYVMDLANGQRVGVAVAEVFARRWRAKLSRGVLPETALEASRPPSSGLSHFFAGRSWYVGIIVGLALVAGLIAWGMWERRSTPSGETAGRFSGDVSAEMETGQGQRTARATTDDGKTSPLESLSDADRVRAVALFNDIEDFGHEFDAAFTSKNLPAAETGTRRLLALLTNFNAAVKGTGYEFSPGIFDDIAKVREALREGNWDKVRQAARHNDAYAREFKRISARMVELARQQRSALGDSSGPVVEKVLPGKGDEHKRSIDGAR